MPQRDKPWMRVRGNSRSIFFAISYPETMIQAAKISTMSAESKDAHSHFDAFVPPAMAKRAEAIGQSKVRMRARKIWGLAVLAGAFIGLGAMFATTVSTGVDVLPFGVGKLLGGLAFCLGLILVVVAGAELFTGNNLIVMAVAARKVSVPALLRNWGIVYSGNFLGAVGTAVLVFASGQYRLNESAVGKVALSIAQSKCQLDFVEAFFRGILCNTLVCLAVWLCLSARSTNDKIVSIVFPITAFVAAGFEHSVANMYFIPFALWIKSGASMAFWDEIHQSPAAYSDLNWSNFFAVNLFPVTLGNIVGGSIFVALVYWFIYLSDE